MTGKITELDEGTFDDFIREDKVVVDFWAPWCGPCKMMAPILDAASEELKDKAKFAKVNVDENNDLAQRFGVMSIPTLAFFRDGELVDRVVGVMRKEDLTARIKSIK